MLNQYGFEAITARDGFQAIQALQFNSRIEAVILDFHMPGMDGVELASVLKSCAPDLPILMISSEHPEMDELSVCIDAAMRKGVPIRDIVGRLELLLAERGTRLSGTFPC
jgi:DNA-binding response OmpR family regulator